jgi:hypothetical protein
MFIFPADESFDIRELLLRCHQKVEPVAVALEKSRTGGNGNNSDEYLL